MSQSTDIEVKLCGLRSVEDVRAAAAVGANFAGIVLVPGARRAVTLEVAAAMVQELASDPCRPIGLVGGAVSSADVRRIVATTGLRSLQLVGNESQARGLLHDLGDLELDLHRTLTLPSELDLQDAAEGWEARGVRIVFDAAGRVGELGGTGHRIDADAVRPLLHGTRGLAGGLNPRNVADIVRDLQPALVDVSSGIEDSAGVNDPALMAAFVEAARRAASEPHPEPVP
ncbi:MAG: trpF [Thermoleophilia bacterium]|nr:trpF [Thermoleophilia bacterium]